MEIPCSLVESSTRRSVPRDVVERSRRHDEEIVLTKATAWPGNCERRKRSHRASVVPNFDRKTPLDSRPEVERVRLERLPDRLCLNKFTCQS